MPVLHCPCCGLEIEAADVEFQLNVLHLESFDGHCRDCRPNRCPACD